MAPPPTPPRPDPSGGAAPGGTVSGPVPNSGNALNIPDLSSSNRLDRREGAEEDRAWVERARAGDREAFRLLVQKHQRRAFLVAVGVLRHEQDAREVVQEAFLRVYRSLDRFEGNASFFTWLYRIVTNLAIDRKRGPSRRTHESLDGFRGEDEAPLQLAAPPDADPSEFIRRREIAERVQLALDALPPYHRTVIVLREVEGLSYQEMADTMNVSKGTIMSRLFHARQKLQRALVDCYREQLGAEPPFADDSSESD